ncbi:MAG: hypothetical protein IJK99_09395 [Bacteroidales bacterium]|nr:hypothetical protein [Bacteroidales bacterium]
MTHLIQTSTDLLPILCPDLYESAISPSVVFDWEQQQLTEELPEDINPYEMAIDLKKYLLRLVEYANEVIEADILPTLKRYGVIDIKAMDFHHPDYYRLFSGRCDTINLNILVDDSFFTGMAGELERMEKDGDAQRYCRQHWSDAPGFWSYMPDTVEKIAKGWDYFTEVRQRSAYLTLLCRENGLLWRNDNTQEDSEAQSNWEAKVNENLYFEDFISEEDAALIAENRVEA